MRPSELIDTQAKWCRGSAARDKFNVSVTLADERACKFCLTGAVAKALNIPENGVIYMFTDAANSLLTHFLAVVEERYPDLTDDCRTVFGNAVFVNDDTTLPHAVLLDMLREAERRYYKEEPCPCPAS